MRARIPWHINSQYPVPPAILDDPIPLLDKYLLALDVLIILQSSFNLLQLLPHLQRGACFHTLALVQRLDHVAVKLLLGLLGELIQFWKGFPLLVEWNMLRDTLGAKSGDLVSSDETRGSLALQINIGRLYLIFS